MRTKFILFLLVSLFCFPVWSQAYKPLLDDFNEWHFTTCFFGCLTDVYYTNGDTIVNGKSHKVLDGFHYISRTFLLHEEVVDKQVFLTLVDPPNNPEYLLYDFSLAVGDSIDMKNPITPFPEDAGYYKVDSIVLRPLIDTNEYRHFYLSPTPSNTTSSTNAIWIEGVGSLSLITAPSGDPDINGVGALSCFFKEAELFYSNLDSIDSCDPVILAVNSTIESFSELEVSTLVSNGYGFLNNASQVKFVDVFDLNGRRMKSIENSGENRMAIDFSTYASGVYIMVVYDRNFRKKTYKILVD